eukprot:2089317-Prorocentrum_lima.AAC.1
MTSSLVGSEMCIRDRAAKQPQSTSTWQVLQPTFHHRRRRQLSHRQWSVSYTHLTLPTICSV